MKKKYKLVLRVPKTPKGAYNHGRFISGLIEHQLKHFNEVEKSLLKPGEKLTNVSRIKTELQASKYLRKMTAHLHPQGAEKPRKSAPPLKARTGAKSAKSRAKSKATSKQRKRKKR
jgi:hypothetical protein